jgi:Glycosyl transferase family 11.
VISFRRFGQMGRLGNQLFQYAFLRTTARRLGVTFYCPRWIGDDVYELGDASERSPGPQGIRHEFVEQRELRCLTSPVVRDGTNVTGYFQAPFLFDRDEVRRWFSLRPAIETAVTEQHRDIDFTRAIGLHLRLGDYIAKPATYLRHYVPTRRYYAAALSRMPSDAPIVVSSDEPQKALAHLGPLVGSRVIVLRGNRDYEDLFLLSGCRHLICSPSTFSWWAAWLRPAGAEGIVCVPREGLFRPAYRVPSEPEVLWHQPDWTPFPAVAKWDVEYWRARYRVFAKHIRLALRGELAVDRLRQSA